MINIDCLSKTHIGCPVKVEKDHDRVICQIFNIVQNKQSKIIKFNQNNHNILTKEFPNMKKNFQENVTVMKRIKKDKNYNNEALVENVKRKYKSSIYSSSFILLKYFRNTLALLYFISLP